jgi:hypothetical protein
MNYFQFECDDSYLHPHFCIHGLATSIHQNTQARLKDIATPCAHQIDGNIALVQGLPVAHRISCNNCLRDGYRVKPRNSSDGRFHDSGGDSNKSQDHGGRRGVNGRIHDSHILRDRGGPRGAGGLSQPDCNQRLFLEGVQCVACKRVGHIAKQCDMLATAICLEHPMKNDLSATFCNVIEKEWLNCWKERLGNPNHIPCQVMRTYVEELDITVAGLDEEMDWSCWASNIKDKSK